MHNADVFIILAAFIIGYVSGAFTQKTINSAQLQAVIANCEPNGGVDYISQRMTVYAVCNNGAEFRINEAKQTER